MLTQTPDTHTLGTLESGHKGNLTSPYQGLVRGEDTPQLLLGRGHPESPSLQHTSMVVMMQTVCVGLNLLHPKMPR